ncbi:MAG TPA: S46 family peptidase, partial [Gemmatales bacterium]|nr:S46 family peptidase [Gemmatales bacterium]
AKNQAEEVPAKDLELNVLLKITDVTEKVNQAASSDLPPAEAALARRKVMNELEAQALEGKDKNKFRADVVTLYNGGAYHLYEFKRYTDVRLVFAPEKDIAFFGGDPDNFEYPRYDLDVCFFRAYEDGKPARPEHYLKWSEKGTQEGDLTFVSGHPGRTSRGLTMAHLEYLRDKLVPYQLNYLRRLEVLLKTYSDRSKDNKQEAQEDLFSVQNSRKARIGGLGGLQAPVLMGKKAKEEADLREAIARDPKLKEYEGAFAEVEATLKYAREYFLENNLWERAQAFQSDLFGKARTLVRLAEEKAKPDGERLREYRSSGIKSLELALFSEAPIHENLEVVRLAD